VVLASLSWSRVLVLMLLLHRTWNLSSFSSSATAMSSSSTGIELCILSFDPAPTDVCTVVAGWSFLFVASCVIPRSGFTISHLSFSNYSRVQLPACCSSHVLKLGSDVFYLFLEVRSMTCLLLLWFAGAVSSTPLRCVLDVYL
jgi:hypothetical protein